MPTPPWLETVVWTDYRLALLFAVVMPLILLLWSTIRGNDVIQRLLIIYWRVSSLLAISVYILIAALPIGFVTGFLARILVALGLWFWVDVNEALADLPKSPIRLVTRSWRWALTIYFLGASLAQIPSLGCAFRSRNQVLADGMCRIWLKAPWGFQALMHPTTTAGFLGFLGIVGLIIYVLYLGNFVLFRLGKQGRLAFDD